ncbi:hypothetical protein EDC39_101331 [Geothermobacter ehrlichii]|uniref:FlgN protein n=1 Tax=Geothermobacter ehrlichii TaxID=213224 RepID=A0A5D3WQU2_9BACT|nr:hypothetical protein [Geothermobacter ehrlichii]TYP00170.1 hypothetical protein EDC39_101331 [Geothermobacter ehrlichii]
MKQEQSLYELMKVCNEHYRHMLRFMEELYADMPKTTTFAVRESLRSLGQMQNRAKQLDGELRRLVQQTGLESLPEDLLAIRRELLADVARVNSLLVDRIEGKIVVLDNELRQNRLGRAAMTGYRSAGPRRGQVVHVNF